MEIQEFDSELLVQYPQKYHENVLLVARLHRKYNW